MFKFLNKCFTNIFKTLRNTLTNTLSKLNLKPKLVKTQLFRETVDQK